MSLAIVIVSWNVAPLLVDCLRSIPAGAGEMDHHVMVVDNGSTDESAEIVARQFPRVQLIRNSQNVGFTRANNQGTLESLNQAKGQDIPYVLLLNCDTVVRPLALQAMVRFLDEHPDVGAVGPRQVRADGSPLPYTFGRDPTLRYLLARGLNRLLFHHPLHDWATETVQEVDWISGACLLARREAIDQVGLLDENIFMYFEDVDWCLRFRQAGWKVYYNPQVKIIHLGGQSLIKNPAAQQAYYGSLEYFYAKHYGALAQFLLRISLAPYRLWVRH
jgi:N-acetylglucosaminyl-diphospho-decaprenol L-rhamnosyltransferase